LAGLHRPGDDAGFSPAAGTAAAQGVLRSLDALGNGSGAARRLHLRRGRSGAGRSRRARARLCRLAAGGIARRHGTGDPAVHRRRALPQGPRPGSVRVRVPRHLSCVSPRLPPAARPAGGEAGAPRVRAPHPGRRSPRLKEEVMTPRSLIRLEKSTTGRLISAGVRVLDTVAPAAAQRLAFDWFGMPRRRSEKPFILGHRFRVTGDGPDLAVWDWGDGRTVLLVHGWNGNGAQLAGFVPPLLRAGCYVAAPDLPAHGSSGGSRANVRVMA